MDHWSALTESELATAARMGRTDAFGALVQRHQAYVFTIANRLMHDRQEALDLTQEAFLRAYSALNSFDPRRPFGPWIARIVTNLALNRLAVRGGRSVPLRDESAEAAEDASVGAVVLPDERTEPERLYLRSEQQDRVRAAVAALPAPYRTAIVLRHFQEYSYEEIAAALAIPLSDVKSHLFRARRMLRARLEEEL